MRARRRSRISSPRLYDPHSGQVTIGGSDIKGVTQESLHDAIGVVTQDAHMFHDTIRANLSYAKPGATESELDRGVPGGPDLAADLDPA